jgi:carboxypeptidase C (cathepsin A)
MRRDLCVLAGICVLLARPAAGSQSDPQRPGESPSPQITVPPAQQPGQPQRTQRPPEQPGSQAEGAPGKQTQRAAAAEEKSSTTHHSTRIGGQEIKYAATAATYNIKADDGTVKATMFYVAYTKDGVTDIAKRPVSFVYNGGPGSASLFTHMAMGPRRVVLKPDGHGMPAPYTVTDNEDSLLEATDLVFIDAISTGFSRPAPGEVANQFHGIIADANWFADFIYQYVTRNDRWASAKFLIGESYGTTRSAELAGVLQERHQIYLSGIVLLSSVAFSNWGADNRSEFFLPTLVTTAWYHHLLPADLQKLTIEEVARLTPKYIEQTNLRISPFRWFKELERDKRRTIGRLDSRFEGMDADAAGERAEYDPSEASYEGAFVATFHDYVRRELKWDSDAYYTVSANVRPWDQAGNTEVAEVLRAAMTQQTYLKVLVLCGYYDVATPFNGIENTVAHMNLEPPVRKNVSFAYYEAGHMMYVDEKEHHKLHKDVDEFINSGPTR